MGSTFVIIGLIPLLVLIGIAAGAPLIILGLRQRAVLRRAAVNADNPGCTKCLYIVRGWDSSVCPECGVDVRQAGVRVGANDNRFLRCVVALVVSGILSAIILWNLCGRFLATQADFESNRYATNIQGVADGYPAFQIQIQTRRETGRFPEHTSVETELIIDRYQTLGPRPMPLSAFAALPRTIRTTTEDSTNWHDLYIAADDQAPTEQDILDLVDESLQLDTAQASVVAKEIHRLTVNQHAGATVLTETTWTPRVLNRTGPGNFSSKGIWWPGQMVMWVGTIVTTVTFVIWVFRRHKTGVRPVEENEWARTATDSHAEPA